MHIKSATSVDGAKTNIGKLIWINLIRTFVARRPRVAAKIDTVHNVEGQNQKVAEAMGTLLGELNNISSTARKECVVTIVAMLRTEHRTIQQSFWDAILKVQMQYADFSHDGRNEAAVEFAKAVRDIARLRNVDMGFPFV